MREIFDRAYKSFIDIKTSFGFFALAIAEALIYLTTPFWIIPYAIIKYIEEGRDNG